MVRHLHDSNASSDAPRDRRTARAAGGRPAPRTQRVLGFVLWALFLVILIGIGAR